MRQFRRRQVDAALEVAHVDRRPAVVVLDPCEHAAVRGAGDIVDVVLGRRNPFARAGLEGLKGEPGELAALVGDDVEAGAVALPRPREVLRLHVVRRRLGRIARFDVDHPYRRVAVRPELDREKPRAVRREADGERVLALAEEVARLGVAFSPDEDLAVGRRAHVRGEGEALAVRRPRSRRELVLHLFAVGDLLRPTALRGDAVELVELVAVVVGVEEDRPVLADGDAANGVVDERRQLVGPAAVELDRPQVELAGEVGDEEHALTVRRQLRDRIEAPKGEELLERRPAHRNEPTDGARLHRVRRRCAIGRARRSHPRARRSRSRCAAARVARARGTLRRRGA